jgi:hypothetical protein
MIATEAAIKIQAQWRRCLVEKRLSFRCVRCEQDTFYTSCYQRGGSIRCFGCTKRYEEEQWYQEYRMDEIAAERERCSACAGLPDEKACCSSCTRCAECGDKVAKNQLKKIYGDKEPLYCESCYYEIMDEMAQHEVCEDCGRGDCYGCAAENNGYVHHCGDDTCDGDCGVLSCGVCIDKHKGFCPMYGPDY